MIPYTYDYTITVPAVGEVRITPCGTAMLRATSDRVTVDGYPPFYVHCLTPRTGPTYYQLTGNPRTYGTLAEAIAAHLAPLTPYPGGPL